MSCLPVIFVFVKDEKHLLHHPPEPHSNSISVIKTSSSLYFFTVTTWSSKMFRRILAAPLAFLVGLDLAFLAFLWLALLPLKLILSTIAKLFRPDLVEFISDGYSFVFAHLNPSKVNIVTTTFFADEVPLEIIQKTFQERVLNVSVEGRLPYARLRQTWTHFCGYAFWQWESKFNLTNHLRAYDYTGELQLPQSCEPADLERVSEKLLTLPWKKGQSPWEYLVVYGVRMESTGKPGMAHIFRRHHALMDGFSRVKMFQDLCQNVDSNMTGGLPARTSTFSLPVVAVRALYDSGKLIVDYVNVFGTLRLPHLSNELKTVCTNQVPVQLVKQIKNKYGVSYASVLYSIVGGALYRILQAGDKGSVKDIGLFVSLPKPNHPGGMVNHLNANFLRLPIAAKSSLERLYKVQRTLHEASVKTSRAPLAIEWLYTLLAQLPYIPVFWFGKFFPWFNIVVSNFPVQDSPASFEGSEVVDQFGCMGTLVRPFGCTVVLCGVRGNQRICITVDRSIIPSEQALQDLKNYIQEEIMVLCAEDTMPTLPLT